MWRYAVHNLPAYVASRELLSVYHFVTRFPVCCVSGMNFNFACLPLGVDLSTHVPHSRSLSRAAKLESLPHVAQFTFSDCFFTLPFSSACALQNL